MVALEGKKILPAVLISLIISSFIIYIAYLSIDGSAAFYFPPPGSLFIISD
jgi:hypothetical protein